MSYPEDEAVETGPTPFELATGRKITDPEPPRRGGARAILTEEELALSRKTCAHCKSVIPAELRHPARRYCIIGACIKARRKEANKRWRGNRIHRATCKECSSQFTFTGQGNRHYCDACRYNKTVEMGANWDVDAAREAQRAAQEPVPDLDTWQPLKY